MSMTEENKNGFGDVLAHLDQSKKRISNYKRRRHEPEGAREELIYSIDPLQRALDVLVKKLQ